MLLSKHTILAIFALIISLACYGGQEPPTHTRGAFYVEGMVRDSVTLEPLPYASISIIDKPGGALANEHGIFQITVPDGSKELQVSCLGYDKKIIALKGNTRVAYDVLLSPIATDLKEVVVRRKKYSKKNNPAVDFVRALRQRSSLTDPRRNDFYTYDKHQMMSMALNDFKTSDKGAFSFLSQYVDTSEISGKPILNLIVKEKVSNVQYRKSPYAHKEVVKAIREYGIDEVAEQDGVTAFMEDFMKEVDLYQNDINIFRNRFVSPLSRIGPDFYKYYLTDTVEVDSEKCIVLSFYPHNTSTFGFNGQVYVPMGDSTMFIKKAILRNPKDINLNFVNDLYIIQEFDRAPDGSRLKTRDDLTVEARVLPGTPELYVRRNLAFANHSFNPPADQSYFNMLGTEIVMPDAYTRDIDFWDNIRLLDVSSNEKRVDNLMSSLRSVPIFYWSEKILRMAFTGYVATGNPSKFDYGPLNTSISANSLEGVRLRTGGMTTANLSKRFFVNGYVAYGTRDKKWKYKAEIDYSFHDKAYHQNEFPIHSLRLTSLFDVDKLGQHYLFTSSDNVVLALKRLPDRLITYHNLNKLQYTLELPNHFSIAASVQNEIQRASRFVPFVTGDGRNIDHFATSSMTVQLRFAPNESFYQTRSYRFPINHDASIFTISHTIGPKGFLGSNYMVNTTEASFQKRIWFSAFGYMDAIFKGGHVWCRTPYTNLLIPNANLSYTIQPESYSLMNPMEFVNDSYASWDLTYFMNGLIFNRVPLIKKLKLREVVSFRGLWGHLSDKNNPRLNPDLLAYPQFANVTEMTDRPYMEISAGLDNIFSCLRVDYVWRLSYTHVPYAIDRRGLRIAVHISF